MNTQPLISVLIANYNNGTYLQETLDSVYQQSYTNWEIIIVDDYSTDNSHQIYDKYKDENRIKVFLNDQNRGCGYTKYKCIDKASGEICTFLDPDDTITTNALEIMVKKHIEEPECSLVHSKLYLCDEELNITSEYTNARYVKPHQPYFFNIEGEVTALSSFKKNLYDQTPGINRYLKRAIDQDLYIKLYEVGSFVFIDEPLYYYRIHKGGISTNTNRRKAYYWHWMTIFDAIERRNINFEDKFYDYFIPKHEYDYILKKYNRYKILDKIIERLKRIFNRK